MRHRGYIVLFTLVLAVLQLSCNSNNKDFKKQGQQDSPGQQVQAENTGIDKAKPGADGSVMADMLWDRLASSDYRKEWKYFPGKQLYYMGTQHGRYLITYLNKNAYDALHKGAKELPFDSILVTESYTPDNELENINVMHKVQGYNPQGGDWFWVRYSREGIVQTDGSRLAGRVQACISCHSQSTAGSDYIMK